MQESTNSSSNVRSRYSPLYSTWCGDSIPKDPYVNFNPPIQSPIACPADWNNIRVPNQEYNIVLDYKPLGYQSLTHQQPYSQTPYMGVNPAYECNKTNRYYTRIRKCDGTLE